MPNIKKHLYILLLLCIVFMNADCSKESNNPNNPNNNSSFFTFKVSIASTNNNYQSGETVPLKISITKPSSSLSNNFKLSVSQLLYNNADPQNITMVSADSNINLSIGSYSFLYPILSTNAKQQVIYFSAIDQFKNVQNDSIIINISSQSTSNPTLDIRGTSIATDPYYLQFNPQSFAHSVMDTSNFVVYVNGQSNASLSLQLDTGNFKNLIYNNVSYPQNTVFNLASGKNVISLVFDPTTVVSKLHMINYTILKSGFQPIQSFAPIDLTAPCITKLNSQPAFTNTALPSTGQIQIGYSINLSSISVNNKLTGLDILLYNSTATRSDPNTYTNINPSNNQLSFTSSISSLYPWLGNSIITFNRTYPIESYYMPQSGNKIGLRVYGPDGIIASKPYIVVVQ